MKNIFNKKLYDATNKAGHGKLIIASDMNGAMDVALKNGFVKNPINLKLKDISEEYITQERLDKGLNFDSLSDGYLGVMFEGKKVVWSTWEK